MDKMERKVQEIEIAIEQLDFKDKVKVLGKVLDNMYQKAEIKYIKATNEAFQGKAQKEMIKEARDGKA